MDKGQTTTDLEFFKSGKASVFGVVVVYINEEGKRVQLPMSTV